MLNYNSLKIQLLVGLSCLLFSSCFKSVDFEQAQEIQLNPDLEADLLYYTLDKNDFLDSETNSYTPIIRDTVRLEFLDDSYVQDGLMHAEFRFRHENTFPYLIKSSIRFLSERDRTQFRVDYEIPAGAAASPSIVDTVHVMAIEDISKVRRSIKMLVELEIVEGEKVSEGNLDFLSKGLFKFEF